jgi:hypothetical protein
MKNYKNSSVGFTEKIDKKAQSLVQAVNYHIKTSEHLKNVDVVNIKSAKHLVATGKLKIGFTTIEGKYGTVLEKLKKSSRSLSDYLFSLDLFFRPPKIEWFVEKEDDSVDKVRQIILDMEKSGAVAKDHPAIGPVPIVYPKAKHKKLVKELVESKAPLAVAKKKADLEALKKPRKRNVTDPKQGTINQD